MLQKTFYGNTILDWIIALLIIVAAVVIGKTIYWFFKTIMRRVTAKTKNRVDDILMDTIEEPLTFALIVVGIGFGIDRLVLHEKVQFWVDKGIYILIIIAVAWFITRFFDAIVKHYIKPLADKSESDLDDQILPIVNKGLKTVVWVVAIIVGLDNAGYDVGAILAGLGIGGLALAMAAKDMVSNLFGGFTIFTDRPFTLNDRIVVDGIDGTVIEVGIRSTRLKTLAGRTVTLPNSVFQSSPVENISSEPGRKVVSTIGLTYDMTSDNMQQAIDILNDIAASNSNLNGEHLVGFSSFGDFSMNLTFIYWIIKGSDIIATNTEINMAILTRFSEAGLEMAFPTQTVYHQALPQA
jgi:MscS family membrane protein